MNPTKREYFECGTCRKVYVYLEGAEKCCTKEDPQKRMCECGKATVGSSYKYCDSCVEQRQNLRWECAERADSSYYLYSDVLEKFIYYPEDLTEEILYNLPDLDEDDEEYQELINASTPELARRYRIYLTEPAPPRHGLNLHEYFDFDEYEDGREMVLPNGWKEAEDAVNDWLRSVPLEKWPVRPSNIAWSGQ